MSLDTELTDVGFELLQSRSGSRKYTRRSNPYLQWWVIVNDNGTAELQWELELGAYLHAKGFHVAVQDELSLLMYPKGEAVGPADVGWVADEIARAEAQLSSVDLSSGL